jgi:hypothetical protein
MSIPSVSPTVSGAIVMNASSVPGATFVAIARSRFIMPPPPMWIETGNPSAAAASQKRSYSGPVIGKSAPSRPMKMPRRPSLRNRPISRADSASRRKPATTAAPNRAREPAGAARSSRNSNVGIANAKNQSPANTKNGRQRSTSRRSNSVIATTVTTSNSRAATYAHPHEKPDTRPKCSRVVSSGKNEPRKFSPIENMKFAGT